MNTLILNKDHVNNRITGTFTFDAPLNQVWDAFTNPVTMEKWFAPKPYKAITKISDFKEGGYWLYYMLSPQGEKFWSIARYKKILFNAHYETMDAFCDENGQINTEFPQLNWQYDFSEENKITTVQVTITLVNSKEMSQLLEMGFEEGYKTALIQLQEIL